MSNSLASSNASSSQQFCLKWNNHGPNLIKSLSDMTAGDQFVDVTLACEGAHLKAHRNILGAASNFFKELFLANPSSHPIVILKDFKIEDLRAILDFMYKGEVNVQQSQLPALLKTAEVLKVKGLAEVGEESESCMDSSGSQNYNKRSRRRKKRRRGAANGENLQTSDISDSESSVAEEPAPDHREENKNDKSNNLLDTNKTNKRSKVDGQDSNTSSSYPKESSCSKRINERGTKEINNVIETKGMKEKEENTKEMSIDNTINNEEDDDDDDISQTIPYYERESEDDDGMIDVKPIVSFDEGSLGSMGLGSGHDYGTNDQRELVPANLLHNQGPMITPSGPSTPSLPAEITLTKMSSSCPRRRRKRDQNVAPTTRKGQGQPWPFKKKERRPTPKPKTISLTEAMMEPDAIPRGFGTCPICDKSLYHLKRHISEVHLGVMYRCSVAGCRSEFKRTEKLNLHLSNVHGISE